MILSGAGEAGPAAAELRERKIPVLLTVKYPERERESDPDAKEELTALRRRVEAPATAAILAKAGVRFAFQSADMENPRDFVRNIGKAVEAGLDKGAALRALTLTPAEIFGVADRFGSIEPKKTANLIVATGDLFDASTRVKFAFIDGRKYEITEMEPAGSREAAPMPQPAATATGTWSLTVTTPQGPMEVTLKLEQQGENVTGAASYAMGEATLVDGKFAAGRLTFRVSAGGHEASFSGTIHGDSLTGTFNAGDMGTLECRGSRGPRKIE
jgi:hypothetical protein